MSRYQDYSVHPKLRWIIFIAGLTLVMICLLVLAYAFWPNTPVQESIPLSPTLFSLPR